MLVCSNEDTRLPAKVNVDCRLNRPCLSFGNSFPMVEASI